jgi:putative methyltransferase (TIGR04325 family)
MFKLLLKKIIPSRILKIFSVIQNKIFSEPNPYWSGNYSSWEEAKHNSNGYESEYILEKVKDSLMKVKNGEAVYERDSALFDKIEYSWPLLCALLWVAGQNKNKLNIIDFGGSLGSTYYQNRAFLSHLDELKWNIVEQPGFVICGRELFENEHVKFYYSINECLVKQKPDIVLLSSVLQYIEKPYELLREILDLNIQYIIFDITAFMEDGNDRITVQKVIQWGKENSYPAWFFNKKKFIDFIGIKYNLISEFNAFTGKELMIDKKIKAGDKGFIFKIKDI